MSICSCFCILGFFLLIFDDPKKYNNKQAENLEPEVHLEDVVIQENSMEVIHENFSHSTSNASFGLLGIALVLIGISFYFSEK
jgi:hypothetical protein